MASGCVEILLEVLVSTLEGVCNGFSALNEVLADSILALSSLEISSNTESEATFPGYHYMH